jgi:hypothetical protein
MVLMTSLVRHFKQSGIGSSTGSNMERAPISENWRGAAAEAMPEGADPLQWELDQLREVGPRTSSRN